MNEDLAALADSYWDHQLRTSPLEGLFIGDYRYAAEVDDLSRAAEDRKIAELREFADRAEAIGEDGLTPDERVTRAVLIEDARDEAAELEGHMAEFAVDPAGGLHVVLLQLVAQLAPPDAEVADAVARKWAHLDEVFDAATERLREGVASGRTPPRISTEKVLAQLDGYLDSNVSSDPFTLVQAPKAFDADREQRWRDQLRDAVLGSIRPALTRHRDVIRDEVFPASRPPEQSGLCHLPDGEETYARAVRRHTSLEMSAAEIHEIGLAEIAHLAGEYREMGEKVLGTGDLTGIFERLRSDPALRFESEDQIRESARVAMERARDEIPDWFGRLPAMDCVMAEVPDPGAAEAPLAYYLPPAIDGSRPGTFFVNTTSPTTRTRYESEALAFHESIPGHHLQIAIAQELEGIPDFRKHALATPYVEGWGLYAERLADEMGLYTSDVARMGILSFDSWRAGRLVVDTGIHALGWSRQQAIDYLMENSPQAPNNIEVEVDRYIAWPGQALGYKIGQREILRLRNTAMDVLGHRFDIKDFHDVVLGSGPVPLPVLGRIVADWIEAAAGPGGQN